MLSRRAVLLTPLALTAVPAAAATGKMTLCMHQNSSLGVGYRRSLEGWARAGITRVELVAQLVDDFLKTDTLAAARRVLSDNGLTAVSCGGGLTDIVNPNANRGAALDLLQRRCALFAEFGVDRIVVPTRSTQKLTSDDFKRGAANLFAAGEVGEPHGITIMPEFTRDSLFVSTLSTMVAMTREADSPFVRPMIDLYHFWGGLSRIEDLEQLRPGEIAHVHFQDVPDMPRELLDNTTRALPGQGVTPLVRILQKLAERGYEGPLSVELFLFQNEDPYQLASRVRDSAERVMREAGVA